jgi:hypothetical protein
VAVLVSRLFSFMNANASAGLVLNRSTAVRSLALSIRWFRNAGAVICGDEVGDKEHEVDEVLVVVDDEEEEEEEEEDFVEDVRFDGDKKQRLRILPMTASNPSRDIKCVEYNASFCG